MFSGVALAAADDPELAERATRVAFENAQLQDAVGSATRWLALQPDREEARRFLATSLLRLYRNDAAAEQFRAILDSAYSDRARGYTALLGILAGERNETGAALVMDALATADPELPEAQHARSVLWQQAEHGQRALEAARRALELRRKDLALQAAGFAWFLWNRRAARAATGTRPHPPGGE